MSGDHNQYQNPRKNIVSIEAMRQAIDALVQTDTHPISSAEQYFKEMSAMEALEDAIEDAIEQEWVGLTDEERYLNEARSEEEIEYARAIEAKLKEKNT
jgi:hypothetical protein